MSGLDVPVGLSLVCRICRWVPPEEISVGLLQVHFDLEPDHDPEKIDLELVALCERDGLEMGLDRTVPAPGGVRHHYSCPRCHRSRVVFQGPPAD